jgi:hypothetical protein
MNGRLVSISELSESDVLAWRELAKQAIEPNPLFEPECLLPTARYLPNGSAMSLVLAEEDGKFFGCFPVLRVAGNTRPSNSWAGVRRPVFTSQVRRLRYDGTPLLRLERGVEASVMLLTVLTQHANSGDPGILVLEAIDDGLVSTYFTDAAHQLGLPIHTYRTWERPVVQRRAELTYRTFYEGKSVRKLAKLRRQLGEQLGGEACVIDRSGDALAVEQLIILEASGYKLKSGIAMASHLGEPAWFREMCEQFRESNRVLLYSLQVGESVVAMNLLLRAGDGIFGLQTVFDERYAKYSPGLQLELDVIDQFHLDTDAKLLDSCTFEGNETLLTIYPDRRTVTTVLIVVGGRVDRSLLWLSATGQRILGANSPFSNRHPRIFRIIDWALSMFVLPRKVAQKSDSVDE